ncbi:MAG: hypothetical protein P0Y48_13110 [Candidatus Microbacterium phytovorans]|uniref:Uncharacterized protein n=1 Tax=Candidatus Microbacterium phytovorans TaxID=3121374 RepID=A0AAJ6B2P7_9MICO|nr:hypothetical protein [Microbacterium sp.]WEK13383.1 MAG: hypothetical protein P0Y48_13110 [Microbacterium sp.]
MTDILPVRMPSARERRVLAHPPATTEPLPRIVWERIDTDAYAVSVDGATVGFIDVVGRVFVALGGARYDRAVEVAQSLVFEAAVASLVRTVDSSRRPRR